MADAVISPNPRSIARVFADVNHKKGREYWDYEQLNVSATPPLSSPLCHCHPHALSERISGSNRAAPAHG
jgi:hypothetical protein